jgi:DNA primase
MARIPEAELTRLKQDVAIARLAAARGIVLKPSGKNLLGLCPFHDDHNPSLSIDPAQNLWHCFGCQQGGGVIDWVMKSEGVSFRHAVELLRAEVPFTSARPIVKQSSIQKLPSLLTASAEDQELLQQVLTHYQQNLTETPEALAYLQKRGLRSSEMITHFTLGFANRTLGYRLPAKKWLAGERFAGVSKPWTFCGRVGMSTFRGGNRGRCGFRGFTPGALGSVPARADYAVRGMPICSQMVRAVVSLG